MEPVLLFLGLFVVAIVVLGLQWANQGTVWPSPPQAKPPYQTGPRLLALRAALKNTWPVLIIYVDRDEQVTARKIYPTEIDGDYVVADCDLRQDERKFRIDRIAKLEVQASRTSSRARYAVAVSSALTRNPHIDKFPAWPRQLAISEALARGWTCQIVYLGPDGTEKEITYSQEGTNRYDSATITYLTLEGDIVSINRIVSIEVSAPSEQMRAKFRVTADTQMSATPESRQYLPAWGKILAGIAVSFLCYLFMARSGRHQEPPSVLSHEENAETPENPALAAPASSAPKVEQAPPAPRYIARPNKPKRLAQRASDSARTLPELSPQMPTLPAPSPIPVPAQKKGGMVCIPRRNGGETCHYEPLEQRTLAED